MSNRKDREKRTAGQKGTGKALFCRPALYRKRDKEYLAQPNDES